MSSSQTSENNVHELKVRGNAKQVLEAALAESDETMAVFVIRIHKNQNASVLASDMSGYQVAYSKVMFNIVADKLITSTVIQK